MKIEFESNTEKALIETVLDKIVNSEELRFSEIQVIRNILFDVRRK